MKEDSSTEQKTDRLEVKEDSRTAENIRLLGQHPTKQTLALLNTHAGDVPLTVVCVMNSCGRLVLLAGMF